jgi:ribosomal protein S15
MVAITDPITASPSSQFTLPLRPFSSTQLLQAQRIDKSKKKVSRDPYLVAQRNRKKAANLTRRAELESERASTLGDPVRGVTTPFIDSFETGKPVVSEAPLKLKDTTHLNYAFEPRDVSKQLRTSEHLAVPLSEMGKKPSSAARLYPWSDSIRYNQTQEIEKSAEEIVEQNKKDHERASEAIARITALENGSSKDRMRANIARCVEFFGRHNTDKVLPPKAPSMRKVEGLEVHPVRPETNVAAGSKRIGPDTGSSEVQIAILTAKIKTVADFLEKRGKNDKHNKRNLRLLVHRRQKLLQYLRKKERGGPRWQHCIESLGLTEGTWRGEISL